LCFETGTEFAVSAQLAAIGKKFLENKQPRQIWEVLESMAFKSIQTLFKMKRIQLFMWVNSIMRSLETEPMTFVQLAPCSRARLLFERQEISHKANFHFASLNGWIRPNIKSAMFNLNAALILASSIMLKLGYMISKIFHPKHFKRRGII